MSVPADWLVPDWPAPAGVKALFTTRGGGQSRPPYDALNLGTHVGDSLADVLANRAVLQHTLGVRPVFLEQVHGTQVQVLAPDTPDGSAADACLATQPGVACTIMVADCLPILLCDAGGTWVAAAHAGWRGLAGQGGVGVVESSLAAIHAQKRSLAPVESARVAPETIAWLGPCIGPTAFEVGDEVRQAFVDGAPESADCFAPVGPGKWRANLPALARQRLQTAGVQAIYGNDGNLPWCTVSNPSRFFSHRRDRVSGRLAACIWLG
jgi:YfiH family protein